MEWRPKFGGPFSVECLSKIDYQIWSVQTMPKYCQGMLDGISSFFKVNNNQHLVSTDGAQMLSSNVDLNNSFFKVFELYCKVSSVELSVMFSKALSGLERAVYQVLWLNSLLQV